jgi:DNA-binding response OmpR family regulator
MKANEWSRSGGLVKAALECQTCPSPRILVAEDEPSLSKLDTEVLNVCGYQVDNAKNGLTALHKLNDDHFDLAIVEEELPKVTGLELVNALRSNDIMTPVILVMGTAPVKEPNPNKVAQVQAILFKPYTVAELLKTVKGVLRAANTNAYSGFGPPSNWQGPICTRWTSRVSGLTS